MMENEIIIGSLQSLTMAQQPDVSMADLESWKNCDFTNDYVWIFVEGVDDRRIYSPLFGEDVLVWESVNDKNQCGCSNLEAIVQYAVGLSLNNVIGIRDKDYTPYLSAYRQPVNVFMTDTHSIETMMLSTPEVIDGIKRIKPHFSEALHKAYCVCRGVGYLRAYGRSIDSCFSFDKFFCPSNIWNQDSRRFIMGWRHQLHKQFFNEKADKEIPSAVNYIAFIRQHSLHLAQDADICQGHDIMLLLQWQGEINNPYDKFRTYFNKTAFCHTDLYSALLSWSQRNNFTIF